MVRFCEIYCSDVATSSDKSVYETFQKKWQIREVWLNPTQVVSIVDLDLGSDVIDQMPDDLVVTAGFSSVTMNDGRLGAGIKLVGNPQYVAEKMTARASSNEF